MKKIKYILMIFMLGAFIPLTACGTGENSVIREQGDGYRTELTEEEIKGGHVSFQMDENLVVDANVTPKEKYEKGLSSYYLKLFRETNKESEKKFLQTPKLFFYGFTEWEEMLNKIIPGKFKGNAFDLNKNYPDMWQTYQGKDGKSYSFHAGWSNYMKEDAEKLGFSAPWVMIDAGSLGSGVMLDNQAKSVRRRVRDYQGSDKADFLEDAGEYIEKMEAFLEEATGRTVYEEYDFSVVSKETIDKLNQVQPQEETEELEEEYASF